MASFSSIGDSGDVIYSLPVVRKLGGGSYFAVDKPECRPFISRIPLLKKLLESQDYIEELSPYKGEKIDYDLTTFRCGGFPYGVTLAKLQADWLGVKGVDTATPWLKAKPSKETKGKIVISRTDRYRNPYFPYKELVQTFRDRIIFVGLKEEHINFSGEYGYVPYLATENFYDVACAIAGAEMFIGNQSCPYAICEGLKVRSILEVCLFVPDCIYPRKNAVHCVDGGLNFSAFGIDFYSEPYEEKTLANIAETPPGGWVLNHKHVSYKNYAFTKVKAVALANFPHEDLHDVIIEQSSTHVPPSQAMSDLRKARELLSRLHAS